MNPGLPHNSWTWATLSIPHTLLSSKTPSIRTVHQKSGEFHFSAEMGLKASHRPSVWKSHWLQHDSQIYGLWNGNI